MGTYGFLFGPVGSSVKSCTDEPMNPFTHEPMNQGTHEPLKCSFGVLRVPIGSYLLLWVPPWLHAPKNP